VLTNPFVTLAPGQLSTYSIQSELEKSGQCYVDIQGLFGYGFQGFAKPLNVADLACPTFGLGPGTDSDGQPCRTIGPPYLPLIIPPSQVLSLDPGWLQSCKGLLSYAWGLSSFAIYDPPRTLQPASALVPPEPPSGPTDPGTTQDSSNVPAATSPVQPGQAPAPSTPTPTAAIAQSSPSNDDPGSGNAPQDPNSSEGTQAPSGSDPSKGNPSSNIPPMAIHPMVILPMVIPPIAIPLTVTLPKVNPLTVILQISTLRRVVLTSIMALLNQNRRKHNRIHQVW